MRVHLSTDDLPPRDREQFWHDFAAEHVLHVTPGDRPDPTTFRALLDAEIIGRFTLFDSRTTHRVEGRTAADVSRDNSEGFFHLRRNAHEESYTAAPSRETVVEVELHAGDFCVGSSGWPCQSATKEGVFLRGLLIPHEVLSPLIAGGRLTHPIPVPAGSPLGSLLGAAFDAAATQLPLLSPNLGDAVLQNLCGLVALACGASEEGRWNGRESLRTARLEAAKRYIEQHLAEPSLTPGSTAAALGISLRHLHLLFEPTGISFAQYVTQRRLLQCRAALSGPMGVARSVTDIAFGWGFSNLTTFYRAFRREFGMAPGELRASHA